MGFAVEAKTPQEQNHPRGGEPELLSGLQPLFLSIVNRPRQRKGSGLIPNGISGNWGPWGRGRVCWKRLSRRSCMQAIAACTTCKADREVQTRASQGSSGAVTSCSRPCITRWEQRVWVTPVREKWLEAPSARSQHQWCSPGSGQVEASASADQRGIEIGTCSLTWAPGVSAGWSNLCSAGRASLLPVNILSCSPGLSAAARPWAKLLPATRRPIT